MLEHDALGIPGTSIEYLKLPEKQENFKRRIDETNTRRIFAKNLLPFGRRTRQIDFN